MELNKKTYSINKLNNIRYIDVFAGAGGLSEGFIREGFIPVAHVEIDEAASFTLRTRMAYHWLLDNDKLEIYNSYLNEKISREELYASVPEEIISSVINDEISEKNMSNIFSKIDKLVGEETLELIIGGPPCQAYSLVGRSRDKNRMKGDERNYLYLHYCEFLKRYSPKYFVFENVGGLLSAMDSDGIKYIDKMRAEFYSSGYTINLKIISANNYGIPQNRKRVIIIGTRKDITDTLDFFDRIPRSKSVVTVMDVLGDLPSLGAGQGEVRPWFDQTKALTHNVASLHLHNPEVPITYHVSRPQNQIDREIYKIAVERLNENNERLSYVDLPSRLITHKNTKSFLDRFKVVAGDALYSHTIVAHIAKDGHYYIHPDIKQNRSLTPREAARLQTFPDDYFFEGRTKPSRTSAFKQIGNAVPVYLAQLFAVSMKEEFKCTEKSDLRLVL